MAKDLQALIDQCIVIEVFSTGKYKLTKLGIKHPRPADEDEEAN